jgi:uracil-DNA glycosylase family 4
MSRAEKLAALNLDIAACKACPLAYTRERTCPSRGDPRSPLFVIGDIPRQADHKSGEAFSGRAGKKIDVLLSQAGIEPNNVFYSLVLKCFPGQMGRFPEGNEPAQCYGWLAKQLKIVSPTLVILCGPEALEWVLLRGSTETIESMMDWMGKTLRRRDVYGELRFMVIPHPSVLAKEKNISLEERCVKALEIAKKYIVARQNDQFTPDIEVIDIKKKVKIDKSAQIEGIKWSKPSKLDLDKKEIIPPTS